MTSPLTMYPGELDRVADLVGDVDLQSSADVIAWNAIEWTHIAGALGCAQEMDAALTEARRARRGAAHVQAVALRAIEAWSRQTARPDLAPAAAESRAEVQAAALAELSQRQPTSLWRVAVDPTELRTGACYRDGAASVRAFYPDTSPGYFGDGWDGPRPRAESACGWQTPLVLHLGTFPWVYSTRLGARAPGLSWAATGASSPVAAAISLTASLMQPHANLRQDARQVGAVYQTFVHHTEPMIASLPVYRVGRAEPGRLYRRGGFLYVHQGSLELAGLTGPRGHVAAVAYNYVLRRFACFFAVRRSLLRALDLQGPDVLAAALQSTEPALRRYAEEVRHAV